jgi:hypothetical protein
METKCPTCQTTHITSFEGSMIAVTYCPVCSVPCFLRHSASEATIVVCPGCTHKYTANEGGGNTKVFRIGDREGVIFQAPKGLTKGVLIGADY